MLESCFPSTAFSYAFPGVSTEREIAPSRAWARQLPAASVLHRRPSLRRACIEYLKVQGGHPNSGFDSVLPAQTTRFPFTYGFKLAFLVPIALPCWGSISASPQAARLPVVTPGLRAAFPTRPSSRLRCMVWQGAGKPERLVPRRCRSCVCSGTCCQSLSSPVRY